MDINATFPGLEVPNMDCTDATELSALADIFGALERYARHKRQAMLYRASGHIQRASTYESECEEIYRALPNSIRW